MKKPIWFTRPDIAELNALHVDTAVSALGIEVTQAGDDFLAGRMPVDERTRQPFGLMHGGAAVLLLETLASAAANHCVDPARFMCVGMEVNCNHLRGITSGWVTGKATALSSGSWRPSTKATGRSVRDGSPLRWSRAAGDLPPDGRNPAPCGGVITVKSRLC